MAATASCAEDTQLALLETIDVEKLYPKDNAERLRLLKAAKEQGFFLLDFQNTKTWSEFSTLVDGIYELERDVFDLPQSEKDRYDVDKQGPMKLNGYKPIGRNIGELSGGRDGFESWAIPKDGVLRLSGGAFEAPSVISDRAELLKAFIGYMESFTSLIHEAISDLLGLDASHRLVSFHREGHPSPSILRLLQYQEQPPDERGAAQAPHTDLGSLTLLFAKQPGLQILRDAADANGWLFVEPKPGCAIVNVRDMMTMLTRGELKSSLHRVGPLPGRAMPTRYSFAYLQRPEEDTILTVLGSSDQITCGEWLRKKYAMLRK